MSTESPLTVYDIRSQRLSDADAEVQRLEDELREARIHRSNCVGALMLAEHALKQSRSEKAGL